MPPNDPFGWCGAVVDGKYRIDCVVGEGGFGLVYKAFHEGLRETVAVKCLKVPGSLSPEDREKFKESFLDEGRLLHRLSRANAGIAQALDVGAAMSPSGIWTPYLVLEWLEGRGLDEELAHRRTTGQGAYGLHEAVELLTPAALALAEAHKQGIAHRDVKPANMFLTRVGGRWTLKVLDFGIAKVLTGTTSLTRALEATGGSIKAFTPQYGAPEQFDPRYGATGPWTDVFALALVFVETIAGQPALAGQDTIQLMIQAANPAERPTPRLRGANVPQAIEDVMRKALEVQPRERYLTAGDFWSALQAAANAAATAFTQPIDVVGGSPLSAVGATVLAPSSGAPLQASASTTSPQVRAVVPPAPPSARSSSKGWIVAVAAAAGLALVAVAGVGVFFLLVGRPDRGPPPQALPLASVSAAPIPELPKRVGPEMVRVPSGAFSMGSAQGDPSEQPVHEVTITRTFMIDAAEVTVEAYMKCVAEQKCSAPGVHGPGIDEAAVQRLATRCNFLDASRSQHPVNCVDRNQAEAFCKYAGKRLPTEAEWEYAARGPDARAYPWGGSQPTCARGAFAEGSEGRCTREGTSAVGSFADGASPYGALDLAGNVREWVADAWDERAYGKPAKPDPRVVNIAAKGIVRGGAWDSPLSDVRATRRIPLSPVAGDISTGFRCVRNL
jgi:eukaryotic-like serine/threonine-protein kinase